MLNWFRRLSSRKPDASPGPKYSNATSAKDQMRTKYGDLYIGKILHYYPKIQVGIIRIEKGYLKVGDTIFIRGKENGFKQGVTSIEYEHRKVKKVGPGFEVGVLVPVAVKEGDDVYLVSSV